MRIALSLNSLYNCNSNSNSNSNDNNNNNNNNNNDDDDDDEPTHKFLRFIDWNVAPHCL